MTGAGMAAGIALAGAFRLAGRRRAGVFLAAAFFFGFAAAFFLGLAAAFLFFAAGLRAAAFFLAFLRAGALRAGAFFFAAFFLPFFAGRDFFFAAIYPPIDHD